MLSDKGKDPQYANDAFNWYRLAANQGHVISQVNLGVFFATGKGTKINYDEAYYWWSIAAAYGNSTAKEYLEKIERKLISSDQIAKIRTRIDKWKK